MGPEWVAILALVALFVMGTLLPINMGALAYVAAWLVGMYSLGRHRPPRRPRTRGRHPKSLAVAIAGECAVHFDRR